MVTGLRREQIGGLAGGLAGRQVAPRAVGKAPHFILVPFTFHQGDVSIPGAAETVDCAAQIFGWLAAVKKAKTVAGDVCRQLTPWALVGMFVEICSFQKGPEC